MVGTGQGVGDGAMLQTDEVSHFMSFIYLCLCWVLLLGFPLLSESRGYSLVAASGLLIMVASLIAE